jgi:hypothetical protein
MNASEVLGGIWRQAGLPAEALPYAKLTGADPVLPSSFAVGTAAQSTIAAAALAACELGHLRGTARQQVGVDMQHAALDCTGWFSLDGRAPTCGTPSRGCTAAPTAGCASTPISRTTATARCG